MKLRTLLVALLCTSLAAAQTPNSQLTPNWPDATVAAVAAAVGDITGITFIVDPTAAQRKISFVNRTPMRPREIYDKFLTILSVNALIAVPSGPNTMKIVQEANGRTLPGRELGAGGVGPDELVHAVIPVKNINAQQVATVLQQLRSQYGVVQAVPGTNSIIVNDRAANVQRMRQIIERVDQTSSGELDVIPLQYATAPDVVRNLTQLIGSQQQANVAAGIAPRVTSDARTNSILIVGEPAQRLQLATWVASLDTPLAEGGGEPEVIYLKFSDAETLAPMLKEFATGIAQAEAVAAAGGTTAAGAAGATQSASSSAADRSTTILSEAGTNALIVTAPPKMMREIKGIISKLDIPRAQVYIEGIIAEVTTDKAAQLGVNWAMFDESAGSRVPAGGFISPVAGASIVDLAGLVANPDSIPEAAAAGAIPPGATFGVGQIRNGGFNFGLMVRALRTDGESNVIAQPQLLALDNDEAVFQDGQNIPILAGTTTSLGGGGLGGGGATGGLSLVPTQNLNRDDIGTNLTITPQINDGGAMTLDIQLESSELSGVTGDGGSAIINKRSFDTKVRVEDGQTIVLAGMIRDFKSSNETRVPFLGRIPLIGELFKTRTGQRQQKMLMVFIRPTILTDGLQASAHTQNKYNLMRELGRKQGERNELLPILPFEGSPTLPELQQPADPDRPTGEGATTRPVP